MNFKKREVFLGILMTDEQKEGWKKGSFNDAEKALELRKDLKKILDAGNTSKKFRQRLEHYLQPEYENIEYELNNNGCGNLLRFIDDELDKMGKHYWLERIKKGIKKGDYVKWCIIDFEDDN